ncbi:MAG TPA: hypothetical protein VGR97_07955 [Candidatus Acidoferrales bacterium]|nr:hypothetical protein [Candidatus Acidoferrales bacterium]
MGRTVAHLHDDIQAYTLREGSHAWCLSVRHPSRWLPSHELISAFIDNPERAANLLRNGPRD